MSVSGLIGLLLICNDSPFYNNRNRKEVTMSEVEKLYENVGIKLGCCKYAEYGYEGEEGTWYYCKKEGKECWTYPNGNANCVEKGYPPFTVEKQIAILQLLTQQCDLTISHFREWEFIHYDGQEPLKITGKDFTETFAKLINAYWQDLTEEEHKQVKEILLLQ